MSDTRLARFIRKGLAHFVDTVLSLPDAGDTHHVHNALAVDALDTSDLAVGQLATISDNNVCAKANAHTSQAFATFAGVCIGQGWLQTHGLVQVQFEDGLTMPAGDPVYISVAESGKATNVKPDTAGDFVSMVGVVMDTRRYATDSTAVVLLTGGPVLPAAVPA